MRIEAGSGILTNQFSHLHFPPLIKVLRLFLWRSEMYVCDTNGFHSLASKLGGRREKHSELGFSAIYKVQL